VSRKIVDAVARTFDVQANVDGAVAAGWHAVRHVDTATSIRAVEALLATGGRATARP